MKYNDFLIEKVRSGKAQIQVDSDSRWNDLLNTIFLKRDKKIVYSKYYCYSHESVYTGFPSPVDNLPIIQAEDFLVQEPEVKWVEVRNNVNYQWVRAILVADIGVQFKYRYLIVDPGKENKFIGGESNLDVSAFKYMREIPQPEPLTHSELEKLIGKPFKYVAE